MVSIITPFYNAEKYLSECIDSVLSQTYSDWELLLINDGSTDGSVEITLQYANSDPRIKIIDLETNSGAGAARNVGIKKSCGNKIAFLDADDRWYSHKLKIQLQFMQERDIAICYSSYTLMDEKGTPLNKVVQALPTLDYNKLLRANYIGNLTAVYDMNKLEKSYAPELRKRQDWAMWIDLVKKAVCAYGIPEPLAYYRIRNNSISSNK
ncbi:MAG: glycosyltransferase family A protein, partial [Leeuwenhoekiella sp.]